MRGIEYAPIGQRVLCVGELLTRPGQKASTALGIIESALINAAMADCFELLNIKGTKTPGIPFQSSAEGATRGAYEARSGFVRSCSQTIIAGAVVLREEQRRHGAQGLRIATYLPPYARKVGSNVHGK